MADSIMNKRSVCVITGPTRGLGKSITKLFSSELPEGSLFVLLSRNKSLLDIVSEEISQNEDIKVVTAVFDQGCMKQEVFDNTLSDCLKKANFTVADFDQAILVNNAGSLEPLEMLRDLDNVEAITSYFNLNLTGYVALTSKFLQTFPSCDLKRVIINITSLAAVSPMKSWSLYCIAKAGRDILMKVAGEEEDAVRTLNYAPGPLVTEMTDLACRQTKDPQLKSWFEEQVKNKSLVECNDSVRKLISILAKNNFKNGDHIDYYDEI